MKTEMVERANDPCAKTTAVGTSQAHPRILVLEGASRIGGGQRVTLDIARRLRERAGFEVAVPGAGTLETALGRAGIRSHRVGYPAPSGRFGMLDSVSYLPRGIASLRSLISLIRDVNPDLIYATSRTALWAAIAGRITGTPVVVHLHMIPPTGKTAWFLSRVCSTRSVKIVLVASSVIADRMTLPAEKIRVVANGIDVSKVRPLPEQRFDVRSELGVAGREHVAAIVGELSPEKGQLTAIKALAQLVDSDTDAALIVVGSARPGNNSHAEELRNTASSLELDQRVVFTGHRDDVHRVLNGADLLLVPSLGPSGESCPMVVLEAWATGVPVLGADIGGLPEMLEAGRGALFNNASEESLAAEWRRLIGRPDQMALMSEAGLRAVAGDYSLDKASDRIFDALIEATSA